VHSSFRHAWDIQTRSRQRALVAVLPGLVKTRGDHVYMFNRPQLLLLVWDFRSGKVKAVEVREHLQEAYGQCSYIFSSVGLLFHPLEEDTFFVSIVPRVGSSLCPTITVLKYVDHVHAESFHLPLDETNEPNRPQVGVFDGPVAVNEYGHYRLALLIESTSTGNVHRHRQEEIVSFNTITSRFIREPMNRAAGSLCTDNQKEERDFYLKAMKDVDASVDVEFDVGNSFHMDDVRAVAFNCYGFFVGQFGRPQARGKS
jgi:hypothetical protein